MYVCAYLSVDIFGKERELKEKTLRTESIIKKANSYDFILLPLILMNGPTGRPMHSSSISISVPISSSTSTSTSSSSISTLLVSGRLSGRRVKGVGRGGGRGGVD